jgi:hypothetical protein
VTPDSTDGYHNTCHDCERTFETSLAMRDVTIGLESGGYTTTPVPLCPDCIGERFGFDCPQCGVPHDDRESAKYCCQRRPGEAPDCVECGRRMERKSWGFTATGERTVDVAECECCPVGWGRFTGWTQLDDADPCQHIDTDPRGETA